MSEQALVVKHTLAPSNAEFKLIQTIARNAAASGLYSGVGGEQKILMILLAARELGIGPMTALNGGIWNIQGKIELSARLMSAMIRKAGHSLIVKTISDGECTIEGRRIDNGDCFSATFTIQEAQRAGLIRQGSNWTKYPQDMLYARALSRLARRLFADVIGNTYVEGEIHEASAQVIHTETENSLSSEEIQDYINSFYEDSEKMAKFIEAVCEFKGWDVAKAIHEFLKEPEVTREKFEKWKQRQ
jgi:hypothetical protein